MEGRQGHFQTGTQFLEVHMQDGQQVTPNPEYYHCEQLVFRPQLLNVKLITTTSLQMSPPEA